MRAELEILRATAGQIDAILKIERASFPNPFSRELFVTELKLSMAHLHVAMRAGEVVGYIDFWEVGPELHLINIAVRPELRRQGIGSAMMEFLLRYAQRKAFEIYLDVRASNAGAIALYERFGFKPSGVRKGYYRDNGEDAVVMTRISATS